MTDPYQDLGPLEELRYLDFCWLFIKFWHPKLIEFEPETHLNGEMILSP